MSEIEVRRCEDCDGTGEGQLAPGKCPACNGTGVVPVDPAERLLADARELKRLGEMLG